MRMLALLTLLLAALFYPWQMGRVPARWIAGMMAGVLLLLSSFQQEMSLLRALASKNAEQTIAYLRENRQGVIHTLKDPVLGDTIYGGNIYDGRLNTDVVLNSNRIDRVYVLSALHPAPRRVLVIGLSGGAWTRVLAEFEGVQRIDVIEINPGYLDLIRGTPEIQGILHDRRIQIHIDDGRRWLRRHGGEPYDLIVMNTTFHWRAYSTNLLSAEFLQLARQHLAPFGILAFNGTGAPDTLATAAAVFEHAYRRRDGNFIYAAQHDFRNPDSASARTRLLAVGRKLLPPGVHSHEALVPPIEKMLAVGWINVADEARLAGRALEVITDKNLLTEYRYGRDAWW